MLVPFSAVEWIRLWCITCDCSVVVLRWRPAFHGRPPPLGIEERRRERRTQGGKPLEYPVLPAIHTRHVLSEHVTPYAPDCIQAWPRTPVTAHHERLSDHNDRASFWCGVV